MLSCFGIPPKRKQPKPRVNFHLLPDLIQFSIIAKVSPEDFANLSQTCSDLKNKCYKTKQKPFVELTNIFIKSDGIFACYRWSYPWETVIKSCLPIFAKLLVIEKSFFEDLLPMFTEHLLGIRHVVFRATFSDCKTVRKFLEEMNVRIVTPPTPPFPYNEVLNKSIIAVVGHNWILRDFEFHAMDCSISTHKECMISPDAILSKIQKWMTDPFSGLSLNLVFRSEQLKQIQKILEILGAVECEAFEPMLFFDVYDDNFHCHKKFYEIKLHKGYRLKIIRLFIYGRFRFVCVVQGSESK